MSDKRESYKRNQKSVAELYGDILDLPHPRSKKHPPMDAVARAAQFSPFAALTGYDSAVKETARLTQDRIELDEYTKEALDIRLKEIQEQLQERPEVSITYFQPDEHKAGGAYQTIKGRVKKIDSYEQCLVLEEGSRIPIREIVELE